MTFITIFLGTVAVCVLTAICRAEFEFWLRGWRMHRQKRTKEPDCIEVERTSRNILVIDQAGSITTFETFDKAIAYAQSRASDVQEVVVIDRSGQIEQRIPSKTAENQSKLHRIDLLSAFACRKGPQMKHIIERGVEVEFTAIPADDRNRVLPHKYFSFSWSTDDQTVLLLTERGSRAIVQGKTPGVAHVKVIDNDTMVESTHVFHIADPILSGFLRAEAEAHCEFVLQCDHSLMESRSGIFWQAISCKPGTIFAVTATLVGAKPTRPCSLRLAINNQSHLSDSDVGHSRGIVIVGVKGPKVSPNLLPGYASYHFDFLEGKGESQTYLIEARLDVVSRLSSVRKPW